MKILAITDSYPPHHTGGYELRSRDVLEGLRLRGHKVKIITTRCPTKPCSLHKKENDIIRILVKRSETPSIAVRIIRDIIEINHIHQVVNHFLPDVIYLSHLGDLLKPVFFYFSKCHLPVVFDDGGLGMFYINKLFNQGLYFRHHKHDQTVKNHLKSFLQRIIHIASRGLIPIGLTWPDDLRIYFNSQKSRDYALHNGAPVENARVIYSGVDTSVFFMKPEIFLHAPLRIIIPGRIEPKKGIIDSVSLLSLLLQSNIQASLTIIGPVASRTYLNEINQKISQQNLERFVKFLPMVDHLRLSEFYRGSDICFFPSYQLTGLSRIPFEAMASGCLVITYGNEGSSEVILSGETGYIIPEGDIQSVASILGNIISTPVLYQKIVLNANKLLTQKYSLAAYLDQVENIIIFDPLDLH